MEAAAASGKPVKFVDDFADEDAVLAAKERTGEMRPLRGGGGVIDNVYTRIESV